MITVAEIQQRVSELADCSDLLGDGHMKEDELHQDVLRAIADGASDAAELAREALKSLDLKNFPRWYE